MAPNRAVLRLAERVLANPCSEAGAFLCRSQRGYKGERCQMKVKHFRNVILALEFSRSAPKSSKYCQGAAD